MQGISVVIPFYCGNSYLETMAEQLKKNINNFKSDLKNVEVEVILVNDSPWSTIDESKLSAIKQSYKIVVNKKNSGIHQSRVNGINIASCDYILLLDQDDKISENYFESQYEKAMKENADLIIANGVRKIGDKKHPIFKNIRWHKDATTLAPYVAIGNVIASPGQCLIRKNAVPVFWLKNILSDASTICAEKYAKKNYKPSNRRTPQMAGYSLLDMLNYGFPQEDGFSWVELVSGSFVGRFGNMDVFMPKWLINNYLDFIKAGFLLIFLHPVKTFAIRVKKQWSVKGIFNWCMLAAMIIPNILNAYYSYASDYQPQGRYSLPMIVPLTYFMVMGYGNLFDVQIKKESLRKKIYAAICVALAVLAIFVFFGVIWPEYKDVPFSIRAFIYGS